ncbi:hypothetical protein ACEPAI_5340 [Sanghuangporus weigelae]
MNEALLDVRNLSCSFDGRTTLLRDVNFSVRQGDILILQGKSGCGKSTLLKCLAHLNVYEGDIVFRGKTPKEQGVPKYRTHVLYVPQRPSLLPGSPLDFVKQLSTFGAHKFREKEKQQLAGVGANGERNLTERTIEIASSWGVDEEMWTRPWATLSGGEAQRISLAIAVGLDCAEVLLLDEPTSALDAEASSRVEKHLQALLTKSPNAHPKALVWITHSAEQGQRVGTRFIEISNGSCREVLISDSAV